MEPPFANGVVEYPKARILYVDAYDSFSYNVVSLLEENLGVQVTVITVDFEWRHQSMKEFLRNFDAVVLGPGPGDPNSEADVGIMKDLLNLEDGCIVPILGICLGFQIMCLKHGVSIKRLSEPLHGQVRRITTTQKDVFKGLDGFDVTLYHSLFASLPPPTPSTTTDLPYNDLEFLAWIKSDSSRPNGGTFIPMAVRHVTKPFWGFQFHPESCKSDGVACVKLLENWWHAAQSFNRDHRQVNRIPEFQPTFKMPSTLSPMSSIISILEDLTAHSSDTCAFRELSLMGLTTERIFEAVNMPGTPAVLFQSNGRYAVISTPCPDSWQLEYYIPSKHFVILSSSKRIFEEKLYPDQLWDVLRHIMEKRQVYSGTDNVPFWGGFLGYFSYEMGLSGIAHPKTSNLHFSESHHESLPSSQASDADATHNNSDVSLLWVERNIVVDRELRRVYVQSTRLEDDLPGGWLDMMSHGLQRLSTPPARRRSSSHKSRAIGEADSQKLLAAAETELLSWIFDGVEIQFPEEEVYKRQIEMCKSELARGESYELCLTCETTVKLPLLRDENIQKLRPWLLYKKLQVYNPAAFSAFANLGDVKIVSSSPECFINWDRHSMLEMKPMKGTVKKSEGMTLEKAKVILSSTKEMAENLMIADLIRHDLYGICGSGNVHVEKLLEVEDHGRVYQMITHIKGFIDRNKNAYCQLGDPSVQSRGNSNMSSSGLSALQRCLPPGSMTGAPKERSCMHLQAIERRKRGIYSGVMGFLDLGGGGSFSVMIRTLFSYSPSGRIHQDETTTEEIWRIGAGGAVTILSTTDGEWEEMMTKLKTVVNVFGSSKCDCL